MCISISITLQLFVHFFLCGVYPEFRNFAMVDDVTILVYIEVIYLNKKSEEPKTYENQQLISQCMDFVHSMFLAFVGFVFILYFSSKCIMTLYVEKKKKKDNVWRALILCVKPKYRVSRHNL